MVVSYDRRAGWDRLLLLFLYHRRNLDQLTVAGMMASPLPEHHTNKPVLLEEMY